MNDLEVAIGNSKLGMDTIIFNMGSATECPSAKNGTCKLGSKCYALKAEKMYPACKPYRDRQAAYWKSTDSLDIINDLETLLETRRTMVDGQLIPYKDVIKYFRFNESGDFWSQDCIQKLNEIAIFLKNEYDIGAYGYSARSDLDFSAVRFHCKGSGHNNGNNGRTMAMRIDKETVKIMLGKVYMDCNDYRQYRVCPGDCKICSMCKSRNAINIVFPLH